MPWEKFIHEGDELSSKPSSQNALAVLTADNQPDPRAFLTQQDVEGFDDELETISVVIYQASREDSERRIDERISSRRNGKPYSRNRQTAAKASANASRTTSANRPGKKTSSLKAKSTVSVNAAKASSDGSSSKKPKRAKATKKRKAPTRGKAKAKREKIPTADRLEQSQQIERGLSQLHHSPHPDAGQTVWLRKYIGSLTDHFVLSGQPMTIIDWADRYFDGHDVWHVKGSLEVMDFLVRLADRPLEKGAPSHWLNNDVVIGQIGDTKVIVLESEIDKQRGFVKKGQLFDDFDDFDDDEELEASDRSEEEERSGYTYDPDEEQNPERFDDFDTLFDDEDEDTWE